MADNNKKDLKLTTPRGIAKYPWLNKPQTKFDPDGAYSIDLILSKKDAGPFCKTLDKLVEESYEAAVDEVKEKNAGKAKKVIDSAIKAIVKAFPYAPDVDEDGNETGDIKFKFKMKAKVYSKKKNETFEFAPNLFDAQGNPINPTQVAIFGGSEVRVNFTPRPYYMPSTKTAGISLRLNAVQVLELVSGSGPSASSYGFEAEDGYSHEDEAGSEEAGSDPSGADF